MKIKNISKLPLEGFDGDGKAAGLEAVAHRDQRAFALPRLRIVEQQDAIAGA